MRFPILMPKLGYDMETGRIVAWRKSPGDPVERGEILLEVEGDKVTMEVESLGTGTLVEVVHGADSEVPVGDVIAYLETSNA